MIHPSSHRATDANVTFEQQPQPPSTESQATLDDVHLADELPAGTCSSLPARTNPSTSVPIPQHHQHEVAPHPALRWYLHAHPRPHAGALAPTLGFVNRPEALLNGSWRAFVTTRGSLQYDVCIGTTPSACQVFGPTTTDHDGRALSWASTESMRLRCGYTYHLRVRAWDCVGSSVASSSRGTKLCCLPPRIVELSLARINSSEPQGDEPQAAGAAQAGRRGVDDEGKPPLDSD